MDFIKSTPMLMTWARIILIPIFLIVYYAPIEEARFWSALIFMIAAITDWADGYLARLLKVDSKLGAFLDPVADKLIVAAALVMVAVEYQSFWVTIATIVIIMREISISALREWMAEYNARAVVSVSNLGKMKTASQLIALIWLLYGGTLWGIDFTTLGLYMLYFATILTIITWVQYTKAAIPIIIETSKIK